MADLPTAALAYKTVTFPTMMAHDGGSKAKASIQVWRPDLPNNWFYLGQSWSIDNVAPKAIIVRALEPDALKDVASWECVWNDLGSKKPWNFALWRGVPPNDDYVVPGGIFIRSATSSGYPAPDWLQKKGIKAVRKDLVVHDSPVWVWNDIGDGADKDGSVWRTSGSSGVSPNAIIPMEGHGKIPTDICFSLDRSKVLEM